jgi:hypothetical protein
MGMAKTRKQEDSCTRRGWTSTAGELLCPAAFTFFLGLPLLLACHQRQEQVMQGQRTVMRQTNPETFFEKAKARKFGHSSEIIYVEVIERVPRCNALTSSMAHQEWE